MPKPRLCAAAIYSGKLTHSQVIPLESTSKGMPSTLTRSQVAISRASGRQGAITTPQLPITTVVTPCQQEEVRGGSQQIWAS